MCSIGEDDFGDEGGAHAMVPDLKTIQEVQGEDEVLCNKCGNADAVYKLVFREAECKECFLNYARHKFRAALGSSKVLPKNANVLLIFDGSAQSMVLLDMLYHAQTQNSFKRLHCNATVVYIDAYQEETSSNEYCKSILHIKGILSKYSSFESYVMPLVHTERATNSIFNFKTLNLEYFDAVRDKKHEFTKSLNGIKSQTSLQDFVKHHRSKLVAAASKFFKCEFAFMSDISSDLASDLLAAIALGRGGSAALDVALIDDRLGDGIQIVRPLKDLTEDEIRFYIKAQDLQFVQLKCFGDDVGPSSSLQNLTKAFIKDLQKNYSSTVSTVFRTGSKISSSQKLASQIAKNVDCSDTLQIYCSFCRSLLDYRDSTTLLAIEFSRIVSESGTTLDSVNNLNEMALQNVEGANEKIHLKKLCHACRNIYADSSKEQLLL